MRIISLTFILLCADVHLFVSFLADEENSVPKARTHDISLKLTTLPSEPPPGRETQCLKTQTEGATAKVIISAPYFPLLHVFEFLNWIVLCQIRQNPGKWILSDLRFCSKYVCIIFGSQN